MQTREFYDQVPVAVGIIRHDLRYPFCLYANPALRRLLQLPDDYAGQSFEALWPGDETVALLNRLRDAVPPPNYSLPLADGGTALLTIQEGRFENEDVFVFWAADVSAAVAQADAMAQMKANFLATMSHEIRTPMQSVYGLLELIGEEKPDLRIRTMVDIAKTSASGLLEILNDILDFAKMDTDNMELDLFEVPVRTLVRGINEAMAVKIVGSEVRLLDDIAADVPFVIVGDPKRLRQILMNLTGNALKFTRQGQVTLRVSLGDEMVMPRPGGIVLRFEVVDTGIGMSDAVRGKLFQPFVQADSSTSRKYGGTGLGLSICRKLVEIMGGRIGVDSTEGQGSTFWFEIPSQEVGAQTMAIDLPALDGLSVLSVEDHPQGAKEIVRSLESMGATVESCASYREALELAHRRPFDVGIIDQGLPDGLGLDLIREIMAIRPFMGLVMYTVRDDIGLQHSLNALGVSYLSKPASRRGLGETVKDAARRMARVSNGGPARLLIAEDTASVRDILQRQLARLGVEADFVANGIDALDALETGIYGILFTDLHMPGLDGYEVVEMIRQREAERDAMLGAGGMKAHFPVIVLTADVQMGQRQIYLSHGFDECLLKPVSIGQLRGLLIRWGLLEDRPADAASTESEPVAEPVIDLARMREQMGDLDDGAIDMLRMFCEMTAPLVESLRPALGAQDHHALAETGHSLKGAARSACCNRLGDAAAALQDAAERKGDCTTMLAAVEDEFTRVRAAVTDLKLAS